MPQLQNGFDALEDILAHLQDPQFCDVTIVAIDGEILANKVILGLRSQYFRSMFSSNNNFVESKSNTVKMPYSKAVLEKVIKYLCNGEMDCEDMELKPLLDLLEMLNMMNLSKEFPVIEGFTLDSIKKGVFPVSDCLECLEESSRLGLNSVEETLLSYLGDKFAKLSETSEVGVLSQTMIIRLLEEKREDSCQTLQRFKTFVTWLSVNSMDTMDTDVTDEVLKTINFEDFKIKELSSDVRKSGLYSADKIIERMEQLSEEKEQEVMKDMLRVRNSLRREQFVVNNEGSITITEDWHKVPSYIRNKYNLH